eukprot:gene4257-4677_t
MKRKPQPFSPQPRRSWSGRSETELQALSSSIYPILGSIAAVASVIAVHEAGHFLTARWQGIAVQSFNIGYGPKLLSYNETQSGVEYNLRLLPFGGYVAFPRKEFEEERNEQETTTAQDVWCSDNPVIQEENLLENRPPLQRLLVISGGVLANLLLAFVLSTGLSCTGRGIPQETLAPGLIVTSVSPAANAPARLAGIKEMDKIMAVDGKETKEVAAFVQTVRVHPNQPLDLIVERNGEAIKLQVVPKVLYEDAEASEVVSVNDGRSGWKFLNPTASIGIGVAPNVKAVTFLKATNPIQAARYGFDATIKALVGTVRGLGNAFSSGLAINQVGGPVSVVATGADFLAGGGNTLQSAAAFSALLSVNLAVLNALPLPVLDGGQFVATLGEALGLPSLPRRWKEVAFAVALLGFVSFSAVVFLGDVDRFLLHPLRK